MHGSFGTFSMLISTSILNRRRRESCCCNYLQVQSQNDWTIHLISVTNTALCILVSVRASNVLNGTKEVFSSHSLTLGLLGHSSAYLECMRLTLSFTQQAAQI